MAYEWHEPLEGRFVGFTLATFAAVIVGGLVLLVPPFLLQGTIAPLPGLRAYTALELEGRDIYVREGCNTCHSQQVRPLQTETARYGPYSLAGEGTWDRPFLWGSRRTGPDLARVGGRYPDSWHWLHFRAPRDIEPRSNMPSFEFLTRRPLDTQLTRRKLAALAMLGHPYSQAQIDGAEQDALAHAAAIAESLRRDHIEVDEVGARSEAIALIAYLQSLGHAVRAGTAAAGGS
jgi:cbb3-type cytochrome c oxidase subunit II